MKNNYYYYLGMTMKDGITRTYIIKNNLHLLAIMLYLSRYGVPHKMVHIWRIMSVGVDEKDIGAKLLSKLMKHVIID